MLIEYRTLYYFASKMSILREVVLKWDLHKCFTLCYTFYMEKFNCSYSEIVELHKIQPNPKNANKHPEKQIDLLAKIIDYQGQRSPVVVSKRSGFVVKGHGRLEAIKSLGWATVAVDYQDYDSEAQEYADLIADNKIALLADHDDMLMIDAIKDLELEDDFDLDLFGMPDFTFSVDEVEMPELNSGGKEDIEQITFTLSGEQALEVNNALDLVRSEFKEVIDSNEGNSNGTAIAYICERFLSFGS